jgi:hypothetical protein
LKHNNLMLRSEQRERLEAWATSDSPTSDRQYWSPGTKQVMYPQQNIFGK